ncbi:unnamed protein product, partial [Rotaria magnacalcarata]
QPLPTVLQQYRLILYEPTNSAIQKNIVQTENNLNLVEQSQSSLSQTSSSLSNQDSPTHLPQSARKRQRSRSPRPIHDRDQKLRDTSDADLIAELKSRCPEGCKYVINYCHEDDTPVSISSILQSNIHDFPDEDNELEPEVELPQAFSIDSSSVPMQHRKATNLIENAKAGTLSMQCQNEVLMLLNPKIEDDCLGNGHYAVYYTSPKLAHFWCKLKHTFSHDDDTEIQTVAVEFLKR